MRKRRVEKGKRVRNIKKSAKLFAKICSFSQNKSVSGSSFSFLRPETRQV